MDVRDGEKHFNLLGVMGPDEYKPICDNNAYTNRMVKFALSLAAQYGKEGGASTSERKAFLAAARELPIPRAWNGKLVLQCEGFNRLADPRFARLWKDRSVCYYNAVGQERVYRSKALKQADVLMMMMLFPGDFTDAEVRLAWDYYLRYTTHDSSLSPGVHAIMACRLGKPADAWRFWKMASGLDMDVEHGGPAQGIHIANSGATWMIALYGFAGMETAMWTDPLTFDPKLPAKWKRLAFPLIWKGCPVHVDIRRDRITVKNCGSRSLRVKIRGRTRTVLPGATIKETNRNAGKAGS